MKYGVLGALFIEGDEFVERVVTCLIVEETRLPFESKSLGVVTLQCIDWRDIWRVSVVMSYVLRFLRVGIR